MNGAPLITQAEYARRRGVAKSAVAKAVAEKRIRLIDGLIDPEVADIQWANNTRARADSGKAAAPGAQAEFGAAPPAPAAPTTRDEYSVDRARRERYEADMAEMKLREQRGELVRVVDVRVEIEKRLGQLRGNLLLMPARLAPIFAVETDQAKIHKLFDADLRSILHGVAKA